MMDVKKEQQQEGVITYSLSLNFSDFASSNALFGTVLSAPRLDVFA